MGIISFPRTYSAPAQLAALERWAQLIGEWLSNFQSKATRNTYRAAWRNFLAWCGGRHPAELTRADVIAYRDHLAGSVKPATAVVRMAAIASLYGHAKDEGLIDRDPTEGVARPKVQAYAGARWLSNAEARELLQLPDRATLEGKRDFAILVVMLTMGLRRNEVALMRVGDLTQSGDGSAELRYLPKGGEHQTRPVPAVAWRAIGEYLQARGQPGPEAAVFIAHDNAAGSREGERAISGESLRYLVAKYTRGALGRVVNPHALRHTCANESWESTHDLRRVQGMLGHASAVTTERYLHRVSDDRGTLGDALGLRLGI